MLLLIGSCLLRVIFNSHSVISVYTEITLVVDNISFRFGGLSIWPGMAPNVRL